MERGRWWERSGMPLAVGRVLGWCLQRVGSVWVEDICSPQFESVRTVFSEHLQRHLNESLSPSEPNPNSRHRVDVE